MPGVKFADEEHHRSLEEAGYCAFIISKEDRESFHPEVGEVVSLLFGNSSRGLRCDVRLVADQEMKDGGCISIYTNAVHIYKGGK